LNWIPLTHRFEKEGNMLTELKAGQRVRVMLTEDHQLEGEQIEHEAKFLGRHIVDNEWAEVELDKEHAGGVRRLSVPLSRIVGAILLLFVLAAPARADVQYTIPQTVLANLATNLNCTGAPQNFRTGTGLPAFNNLGQTQHYAFVKATGTAQFRMEIDGVDGAGNLTRISDVLESPVTLATGVGLPASGYFPNLQISVTCSPVGGTFTLSYSGTSSTANLNVGGYLAAQLDKTSLVNAPANTSATDSYQTPFGNSAGTLVALYQTAGVAGSSVSITCAGTAIAPNSFTNSLANVAGTAQVFEIPAGPCINLTLTYTTGGATAGVITIEYIFQVPGQPNLADPCGPQGLPKSSAVITAPAAATTQIVAGVASQQIFVCGYNLGVVVAVAGTVQWTTGTGGACGANTVTKTGAIPINTAEPFSYGPGSTLFSAAQGSGVCITLTGAGDNAAGILTYVQH
jgi:hypothetical protein